MTVLPHIQIHIGYIFATTGSITTHLDLSVFHTLSITTHLYYNFIYYLLQIFFLNPANNIEKFTVGPFLINIILSFFLLKLFQPFLEPISQLYFRFYSMIGLNIQFVLTYFVFVLGSKLYRSEQVMGTAIECYMFNFCFSNSFTEYTSEHIR